MLYLSIVLLCGAGLFLALDIADAWLTRALAE